MRLDGIALNLHFASAVCRTSITHMLFSSAVHPQEPQTRPHRLPRQTGAPQQEVRREQVLHRREQARQKALPVQTTTL